MIQQNTNTTSLNQPDAPTLLAQTGVGSWTVMSYTAPILPMHAALLRSGKPFFIAGSGNDPNNIFTTNGSAVWNISGGTFSQPDTPLDNTDFPYDLFCGCHSFLADGRLLFAGGTLQYDPFWGQTVTLAFDPSTEKWSNLTLMTHGRWYGTLVTLGDGRVLAVSGLDENGNLNINPEIYSPSTNTWSRYSKPTSNIPQYAHLFLLSSGKIFYSGGYMGGYTVSPRILTLPSNFTQQITETAVSGLQNPDYGNQAASVLLPPAQNQKVMIIGGGNGQDNATNRVNIIDLTSASPTYTAAASLNYARMHCTAVLLPDRTVFVCGGSGHSESGTQATKAGEIYNPRTNTWTLAASQTYARLYHSVAFLLPDGRVVSAGGNPSRGNNELHLEIYSPPYMSQTRPQIISAPSSVTYGQQFTIGINSGADIKWVSLIRPSAGTHSCDTEQRVVDCTINSFTSSSLTVTVPSNSNLAPPGYYMLFITDQSNVPSVASWIKLS